MASEYLWHWSRVSEIIRFFILKVFQVGVMLDERPKLLTKLRISRKSFQQLVNAKSAEIKVREYL